MSDRRGMLIGKTARQGHAIHDEDAILTATNTVRHVKRTISMHRRKDKQKKKTL
jgi:hypothetical protein